MNRSNQPHDDTELWAGWSQQHGRAVRGYLWGMVRRHDLADDLTQEVFFRAWQARDRYREEGKARAYLLRIADRLVVDYHRKSHREVNLDDMDWRQVEPTEKSALPEHAIGQEETFAELAAALDRLSPAQRRVLLLRYYGSLSFAEIAATMDCPLGTVLSHCHRGLLTLKNLLVETDK